MAIGTVPSAVISIVFGRYLFYLPRDTISAETHDNLFCIRSKRHMSTQTISVSSWEIYTTFGVSFVPISIEMRDTFGIVRNDTCRNERYSATPENTKRIKQNCFLSKSP